MAFLTSLPGRPSQQRGIHQRVYLRFGAINHYSRDLESLDSLFKNRAVVGNPTTTTAKGTAVI